MKCLSKLPSWQLQALRLCSYPMGGKSRWGVGRHVHYQCAPPWARTYWHAPMELGKRQLPWRKNERVPSISVKDTTTNSYECFRKFVCPSWYDYTLLLNVLIRRCLLKYRRFAATCMDMEKGAMMPRENILSIIIPWVWLIPVGLEDSVQSVRCIP